MYKYIVRPTTGVKLRKGDIDIVLDSFNMAYRDKDSILDYNIKNKSSGIFIMEIFYFKTIEKDAYLKGNTALKQCTIVLGNTNIQLVQHCDARSEQF